MRKLAELNSHISDSIALNITLNESINNFRYNNHWVTDVSKNYFEKRLELIEKLIDENIDFDKKSHIEFLKIIYDEVIETHNLIAKPNHENYSYFNDQIKNWEIELNYPDTLPQHQSSDLVLPNPTNHFEDREEYIIEIIKGFFNIEDKQNSLNQIELNKILTKKHSIDEQELESIYAKAHLSYIISLHLQMVRNIEYKLKSLIIVIDKIENASNEITTNPNGAKIEFAMQKQDIAILFHTLHELNIIKTDVEEMHDSQTKLKTFINSSNIYYKDKKSNNLIKVKNINKQFTDLNNKDIDKKEIEFIESFISKLNTRLELIQSRK